MSKQKVIVNICTCNRPVMLAACMDSIQRQSIPVSWEVEILIIDNAASSGASDFAKTFIDASSRIPINYVHESQAGIPFARNRGCRESLDRKADWLAFIDDDETADGGWFDAFFRASQSHDAKIYSGPVNYIYPLNHAKWLQNRNDADTQDGTLKKRASTNNALISSDLVSKSGYGLEFDTNMAFTGGSDTDFFIRAAQTGLKIVHVSAALVTEVVLKNRLSIAWRLKRQYRSSTNRVYINIKLYGYKKAAISAVSEMLRHLIDALLNVLTWPVYIFRGYYKFKRQYYHCLRHLAKAAGNISGLFGIQPQPYQKIDGH